MSYRFSVITPTAEHWLLLEQAADRSCFFTQQWATYLKRMGVRPFVVEVRQDDNIIGHFVGSRRWLGLRIVSAPSMGTGTYAQGLCLQQSVPQEERITIYKELTHWLLHTHKADYIQICDWRLCTDSAEWIDDWHNPLLDTAGIHYQPRYTFHLDMRPTEEELWANLHYKSCKYAINKARKEGLRVQMITRVEDIEAFVHQHHSHILDVLRRHNSSGLPCQREKNMLALCRSLFPDYVLMLQVVGPGDNGQEISMSSGIFTLCNGVCSYFTGGSYQQYMHHCPNELMVWEAIRMMHDRDATDFIFGGVGHYKKKFGSRYAFVPVMVFSRYRFLQDLRITLKSYYQKFTKLLRH